MSEKLQRKYGLFTAICMVVGIVIGSGVFFKAQDILKITGGNMPIGILAWIIGGAIMLVCLMTFSFMGQKYERVNGVVDYAEATVGPKYGYMMGWFTTTIYFPAMTAVLAWVSAMYTMVFVTSAFPSVVLTPLGGELAGKETVLGSECLALTLVYLCFSYGINALSPKLAGKFQTSTTVIKMIPLVLMAVVGLIVGIVSGTLQNNFVNPAHVESAKASSGIAGNPLFASVCATAFAYEGWIIATSINAEIKDSKKNLPKALIIGGSIIVAIYLFYYIGVAGGATNQQLIDQGATVAFTNIFGNVVGNILNLFVVISCLGTTNGLMLGCTRGMYSLADRGEGPAPETFSQVDRKTNMPANSGIFALMVTAIWFLYYYLTNISCIWKGPFAFDSSELPIITIYLMYLPMLIQWMRKEKDQSVLRRFIMPILAFCGSVFMIVACALKHKEDCLWYLIVFAVIMAIGLVLNRNSRKEEKSWKK